MLQLLKLVLFSFFILGEVYANAPHQYPFSSSKRTKARPAHLDKSENSNAYDFWQSTFEADTTENLVNPISRPVSYKQAPESEWRSKLESKLFPKYSVRIKEPGDLGIDDVKQMSGYLDTDEKKHFFFWFFESRNDPGTDPIILWLNGGPGCSSLMGLFMELGPAKMNIEKLHKPIRNPYSWNSNASVIFLDQPVNSGLSYGEEEVFDTFTSAKDVLAFLTIFFQQFPQYAKLDFAIAGESYAGHYLPQIAKEILMHTNHGSTKFYASSSPASQDFPKFTLNKMLIGNGLTDSLVQYKYYSQMACRNTYEPVLTKEQCDTMDEAYPRCASLIQKCYDTSSVWFCVPAFVYCNNAMITPFQKTGKNVYDIRKDCVDQENLCYPISGLIAKYVNLPEVRNAIGAEVDNFENCNMDVNFKFAIHGDWMLRTFVDDVRFALNTGLDVLIYAGDADYICNWYGNKAWTDSLNWNGSNGYQNATLRPWKLKRSGDHVGNLKKFENLSFLQIFNAGHMVPYDQPEVSLDMLNRFLKGGLD